MIQTTSEYYFLDIIATEEDMPMVQALLGCFLTQGWQEESLTTGQYRFLVSSEDPVTISTLHKDLLGYCPDLQIQASSKPATDWTAAWKEFFTPVHAGLFCILPPWLETGLAGNKIPIVIEPRSAFGTGHHPSTTLCLRVISSLFEEGRIKAGDKFLDLGTGTGILGIACAKLGLTGLGLDIDSQAVFNAGENCANNAVQGFEVDLGSIEKADGQRYDLVLANILANPLKEMAAQIMAVKGPNAPLVLSGFLEIQAEGVERAYAKLGKARMLLEDGLCAAGQSLGEDLGQDKWACLYW